MDKSTKRAEDNTGMQWLGGWTIESWGRLALYNVPIPIRQVLRLAGVVHPNWFEACTPALG